MRINEVFVPSHYFPLLFLFSKNRQSPCFFNNLLIVASGSLSTLHGSSSRPFFLLFVSYLAYSFEPGGITTNNFQPAWTALPASIWSHMGGTGFAATKESITISLFFFLFLYHTFGKCIIFNTCWFKTNVLYQAYV